MRVGCRRGEVTFACHRRSIAAGQEGCLPSLRRALLFLTPEFNNRRVSILQNVGVTTLFVMTERAGVWCRLARLRSRSPYLVIGLNVKLNLLARQRSHSDHPVSIYRDASGERCEEVVCGILDQHCSSPPRCNSDRFVKGCLL